jgi:hypothetical protein
MHSEMKCLYEEEQLFALLWVKSRSFQMHFHFYCWCPWFFILRGFHDFTLCIQHYTVLNRVEHFMLLLIQIQSWKSVFKCYSLLLTWHNSSQCTFIKSAWQQYCQCACHRCFHSETSLPAMWCMSTLFLCTYVMWWKQLCVYFVFTVPQ